MQFKRNDLDLPNTRLPASPGCMVTNETPPAIKLTPSKGKSTIQQSWLTLNNSSQIMLMRFEWRLAVNRLLSLNGVLECGPEMPDNNRMNRSRQAVAEFRNLQ